MDNLTEHFIAEKVLAELRAIKEALAALDRNVQKQVEAIREATDAQKQRDQSPPILRAELQIPEAVEHKRQSEDGKKVKREWYALVLNFFTLAAVIAYAWINYHMLCQMKKANEATSKSFAQTLCQMETQTDAQQQAAQAASDASDTANDSLKTTQDSFRDDQRAWVGVSTARLTQFDQTKPFRIEVEFLNTGKTPAVRDYDAIGYRISQVPISGPFPEDLRTLQQELPMNPRHVIAPQQRFITRAGEGALVGGLGIREKAQHEVALQDIMKSYDAIKTGKAILYVFGILQYDDTSKRTHTTDWCVVVSSVEARELQFCETFNDMN